MNWLPKKTVVVPVDFSESSSAAIRTGLEMVAKPSDLHLLHVLVSLDAVSPGVIWGDMTDRKRKVEAQKFFEKFLKKLKVTGVTTAIRIGDPGSEVTEYARAERADLIVIPSHGYHGLKRVVLGSVAERVLRHATCPVLVLRRDDAK